MNFEYHDQDEQTYPVYKVADIQLYNTGPCRFGDIMGFFK